MNMPLLDVSTYIPQLFWLAISFALLYILLSKICIPQLTNIIFLREAKISDALEKARIAQAEALALKHEYEATYAHAIEVKNKMIAEASLELSKEVEKKTVQQNIQFEQQLKEAEKRLKTFKTKAEVEVTEIARNAANAILQDFLEIEVNTAAIDKALKVAKGSTEVDYV